MDDQWPTCPHCGHKHTEAWEWRSDNDYVDCENCGEEFEYERVIDVSYRSFVPVKSAVERKAEAAQRVAEMRQLLEEIKQQRAKAQEG